MASQEEKKLQALQETRKLLLDNLSISQQNQKIKKQEYDESIQWVKLYQKEYDKLSAQEKQIFDNHKKRVQSYERLTASAASINKALEENKKKEKEVTAELEKQKKARKELEKETKTSIKDQSEINKGLLKMNEAFGGTSKLQKIINTGFADNERYLTSIGDLIEKNKDLSNQELKTIQKFKDEYNKYATSVADIQKQVAKGELMPEAAAERLREVRESFKDITSEMKLTSKTGKNIQVVMGNISTNTNEFGESIEKVNEKTAELNSSLKSLGGQLASAVPAGNELLDVFSKFGKVGFAGAMAALGAAAGKFLNESGLLKKLLGDNITDALDIEQKAKRRTFDTVDIPLARKEHEIDLKYGKEEFKLDQKYEKLRHQLTMQNKQIEAAMTFKSEASMAYFGKALPSINFAANQLQNAGISADTIANASISIANSMALGGKESVKFGTEMAVFAKFAGISAEEAGGITESFKLLDNVTAETAANMTQGVKAMAEQLDLNPGAVMKEMADASSIALEMNIQSGKALAKQVMYAQSLGVSFSKVAKAGQNMVLNYKDSIKAEMQLSTLLGEQVDLSEVRAKFAEGDSAGAIQSLQSMGLDPTKMDMFQKQALQSALGGMDLETITKAGKPGAGKPEAAIEAAATKMDNASIHAANKHLLAAETSRQIALDNAKFALEQSIAKKQFDLDERKKEEDFELSLQKRREMFEADLSFDRIRQDNALQEQFDKLGNTILFELIPALLLFGAGGGISGITDLLSGFRKGKGKGKGKARTGSQKQSSASKAASGPSTKTPGAAPTKAQQVAELKAKNPGMTSQEALKKVNAGQSSPKPSASTAKPTSGPKAGTAPKPAAPTTSAAPKPAASAAPKPAAPAAPKAPPAKKGLFGKIGGFFEKLNPLKSFKGNLVTKVIGGFGKVLGPLGAIIGTAGPAYSAISQARATKQSGGSVDTAGLGKTVLQGIAYPLTSLLMNLIPGVGPLINGADFIGSMFGFSPIQWVTDNLIGLLPNSIFSTLGDFLAGGGGPAPKAAPIPPMPPKGATASTPTASTPSTTQSKSSAPTTAGKSPAAATPTASGAKTTAPSLPAGKPPAAATPTTSGAKTVTPSSATVAGVAAGTVVAGTAVAMTASKQPAAAPKVGGSTIGSKELHEKLISMNGNLEKIFTRSDKLSMFAYEMKADLKNSLKKQDLANTNSTELVRLNKNIQNLIDAFLTNNQNEGKLKLMIDGKQVTRVIKRREENETATSPTTPS